jgi:Tol biopolymer transport system component
MPTSFLPDGKHLLFSIWYDTSRYNLAILDIETGKHSVLLKDTAYGVYSPSGHLVFSRWDGVYGVAFDAAAQKVLGPEVLLIRDAWLGELSNLGQFALSANGTLVYRTGKPADRELVLVDMENKAQLLPLPPRRYIWPRFSPDGKRILVNIQGGPYVSFGVFDIEDKDLRMITIKGNTRFPLWAPDGKSIVFSSDLAGPGQWKTYTKVIDNTKPPQLIFDPQKTGSRIRPETFTPDGKTILGEGTLKSVRDTQTGTAIVAMKLDGPGQLTEFIPAQRSVGIYNVRLSQDGRFLAYVSTRSGRNEIWISPYANPAQATMVSKEGGQRNVWSRDGKKIYFVAGTRMMVADVTTDPQLQVTAPRVLFENIPYAFGDYYTQPNWDITPDGKYFIMIRAAQADAPGKPDPSANRLKLITNFFAELSQKARKR